RKEVAGKKNELKTLKAELEALKKAHLELQTENKELKGKAPTSSEVETLKEQLKVSETKVNSLEQREGELKAQIENPKDGEKVSDLKAQLKVVKKELAVAKKALRFKEGEFAGYKIALDSEPKSNLSDLEGKVTGSKSKVLNLKKKVKELQAKMKTPGEGTQEPPNVRKELKAAKGELAKAEKDLDFNKGVVVGHGKAGTATAKKGLDGFAASSAVSDASNEMKQMISALQEKLADATSRADRAEEKLTDPEGLLKEVSDGKVEIERLNGELEKALDGFMSEATNVEALEKNKGEQQAQIDELSKQIVSLRQELEDSHEDNKVLGEVSSDAMTKGIANLEAAEEQIVTLKGQLAKKDETITQLTTENDELKASVDTLEKKVDKLTFDVTERGKEVATLTAKRDELEAAAKTTGTTSTEQGKEIANLEAKLTKATEGFNTAVKELKDAKVTFTKESKALSDSNAELTAQLNQQGVDHSAVVQGLEAQVGTLTSGGSEKDEQIKELGQRLEFAEAQVDNSDGEKDQTIEILQQQLKKLGEQLTVSDKTNEGLQDEINGKQNELSLVNKEVIELTGRVEQGDETIKELEEKVTGLETSVGDISKVQETLEEAQAENTELKDKLEKANDHNNALEEQVKKLQEMLSLRNTSESAAKEILVKKAENLENQLNILEKRAKAGNPDDKATIERLESKLRKLNSKVEELKYFEERIPGMEDALRVSEGEKNSLRGRFAEFQGQEESLKSAKKQLGEAEELRKSQIEKIADLNSQLLQKEGDQIDNTFGSNRPTTRGKKRAARQKTTADQLVDANIALKEAIKNEAQARGRVAAVDAKLEQLGGADALVIQKGRAVLDKLFENVAGKLQRAILAKEVGVADFKAIHPDMAKMGAAFSLSSTPADCLRGVLGVFVELNKSASFRTGVAHIGVPLKAFLKDLSGDVLNECSETEKENLSSLIGLLCNSEETVKSTFIQEIPALAAILKGKENAGSNKRANSAAANTKISKQKGTGESRSANGIHKPKYR
ncbi:hypothetical protein AB751O23_BP_00010, partial [Chlamydiales bacterium SCGC AB-751-O23]